MPEVKYSEGVTPEGAVRYWSAKVPMTPEEYAALEQTYQDAAFAIAGMEDEYVLDAADAAMQVALEEGASESEFAKIMDQAFEAAGVDPLNPHHLDTVFKTNTMSAYSAGRYEQQMDPDVLDEYPWFEFRKALGDYCEICSPMDGYRAPKHDPVWDTHYPPLHHNCACGVYSIHAPEDAVVKGPPVKPADGFDTRPGAYHEEAAA